MTAFQPWSTPGCTALVDGRLCGSEDTVTLSRLGRRCAQHPPAFDPAVAVALMVSGWPGAAMAYVRSLP
ncbi:MAG TPA: hypothetical protein VFH56_05495 [Acidimicrobiales bacterium]|nr:hypothetical protein [Acidimicrobiales bacterium]